VADRRAAAVEAGDEAAFLDTVDVAARPFAAARFAGARSAGFSEYRLRVRWDTSGDLSTAGVRARYAPARVVVTTVEVRITFGGYDERPALTTEFLTFVDRGAGWKVASDIDLESLGLLSSREIWDFGPISRITTPRALVLSHPEGGDRAAALLPHLEAALDRELTGLAVPWTGKVVVVVPNSSDELRRLLQSTVELNNFVAFAYWGVERDPPQWFGFTTPRVVLNPDTFFSYGASVGEDILAHELVHVATRRAAGPAVSSWLDEGLADFVATGPGSAGPPADGQLPEDWRFSNGTGDEIRDAYGRSRSFVAFLARQPAGVVAFYERVGSEGAAAGSTERRQSDAASAVYGRSLADLRSTWAGGG
jgi:hypothetical protein